MLLLISMEVCCLFCITLNQGVQTTGVHHPTHSIMPRNGKCPSREELQALEHAKKAAQSSAEIIKHKLKTLEKAERKNIRIAQRIQDVAFILFVWSCPDAAMAMMYVSKQDADLLREIDMSEAALQERYLRTSVLALAKISESSGELPKIVFDMASRFKREYMTSEWLINENTRKGNAPTTSLVQQYCLPEDNTHGEPVAPVACKHGYKHVSTKWVQRFRRKWGFKLGHFQPREQLPVPVLRQKVGISKKSRTFFFLFTCENS